MVAPVANLYPIADGITFAAAAALPVSYQTAWRAAAGSTIGDAVWTETDIRCTISTVVSPFSRPIVRPSPWTGDAGMSIRAQQGRDPGEVLGLGFARLPRAHEVRHCPSSFDEQRARSSFWSSAR